MRFSTRLRSRSKGIVGFSSARDRKGARFAFTSARLAERRCIGMEISGRAGASSLSAHSQTLHFRRLRCLSSKNRNMLGFSFPMESNTLNVDWSRRQQRPAPSRVTISSRPFLGAVLRGAASRRHTLSLSTQLAIAACHARIDSAHGPWSPPNRARQSLRAFRDFDSIVRKI